MAEVTVLKKSRRQAVVLATGTGTFHCNLTSLLTTEKANSAPNGTVLQTINIPTAIASINDVVFSVDGNTTVTRNGTTYLTLTAGQTDFSFSQRYGFVLNPNTAQNSNANIQINFGSSNGTVILCINKGEGFSEPDLQLLEQHQKP